MDPRLRKMQAVQASLGDSRGQYDGWGLLRPVMENLERYRACAIDREAMEAVLADTAARARVTAGLLEGDPLGEALARLLEALDLVGAALDEPLDLSSLEEIGRATDDPDLGRLLEVARGRLDYEALCREVEAESPETAALDEAMSCVLETLRLLDAGELTAEAASAAILEDRALAQLALRHYEEDTYLAPEEWTADVALADELLTAGLTRRMQALEGLAASPGVGAREPWLDSLREAEWALLLVDRLSQRKIT